MTHGGVEPGRPVVEGRVCALKSEDEERVEGQNCAEDTLPDGDYTIPNLPSGAYKVVFWPYLEVNWVWEYYGDTRVWSQSPWIEIANGPITGISAELPEGGYISGHVTRASDGEGLARAHVCAEEPLTGFSECKEVGEPGGSYQLWGLIEGDYIVEFLPKESQGVRAQFYNGKSSASEAELVHVTTGVQTEPIDAKLPAQATISGRVTDASTHGGLPEIEVCAFGLSGPEITECEFTDLSGSYELTDLPTGAYKVGFFSESVEEEEEGLELSPYPPQFWNDKPTWETADILTLGLGTTNGVDAGLGTPPPLPPQSHPDPSTKAPSLPSVAPLTVAPAGPAPRPHCRSGRKLKKVKGTMRCVKARPRRHHRHVHRRQP
jgi:hypothetical protein